MPLQSQPAPRFVRRTSLGPNEYRKNFRQIDREIIEAITSLEADQITPLMSKIYLRLVSAPAEFWDGEGVLYITARSGQERTVKASKVLYELLGVASATAHKALAWMHGQGIIGYSSGKNGVGIRIFLNRAAGSIGVRGSAAGEKILPFARGSNGTSRGSGNEPAFNAPFGGLEVSETDFNPDAPKNGAEFPRFDSPSPETSAPRPSPTAAACNTTRRESREWEAPAASTQAIPVEEIYNRLKADLEPRVTEVAARTAARTAQQEAESTRVWFKTKALPQAVRVAQRETYNLARKLGRAGEGPRQGRADFEVGRQRGPVTPPAAKPLTDGEVRETAETCAALLEAQGKPVEATLAEISAEGGGWLLAEDVPRVRAEVESILQAGKGEVSLGDGR